LNELPPRGRIILLISVQQLIRGKTPMDIIRIVVSKPGLLINESFLLPKRKMVSRYSRKIFDGISIRAKRLIVLMISSKPSKSPGRSL
jgi:hypothetical protein